MTIQQLIDELNKIEDKSKIVLHPNRSDIDYIDTNNKYYIILV